MSKAVVTKFVLTALFAAAMLSCGKKETPAANGKDSVEVPWSPPPSGDSTTAPSDTTGADTTRL